MAGLAHAPGPGLKLAGLRLPATVRPAVPLTDAELIAFSHENRPYRIERNGKGELELRSPVGIEGGRLEALVVGELAAWAEQHGGVVFSSNAGFNLPDGSTLSPDAAWIPQERWDGLSREERRSFAPFCPDFLIEVLSPSDSRSVLERKMETWMANGARLAWMIDPGAALVGVYRPGMRAEVLRQPDVVVADDVVAGFQLRAERLWTL
jgi:Uma2 family endonuclease